MMLIFCVLFLFIGFPQRATFWNSSLNLGKEIIFNGLCRLIDESMIILFRMSALRACASWIILYKQSIIISL
ncbi:hypothetical protein KP509_04G017800 [Ceratopteris richardii]|uniref:Secreted protein n=1 Tax=Ceratopteris richardii TaxID=49495 RepID=A0A8T2UYE8_CERRI|nr:hypothetical protein KP509_04G017800 [Ceratopteris richardii]